MLTEEDRRTLLAIYGATALEIASGRRVVLGAWQNPPAREAAITGLLERAHRLRGDSSTVELHATVDLLRVFEALLRKMRSGELATTAEHGPLLTAVVDRLADMATGALEGEGEDGDACKELIAQLWCAAQSV